MHDSRGVEILVGDRVTVELTVRDLYPGADTCNVTLVREGAGEQSLTLTCQAKQTTLVAQREDA